MKKLLFSLVLFIIFISCVSANTLLSNINMYTKLDSAVAPVDETGNFTLTPQGGVALGVDNGYINQYSPFDGLDDQINITGYNVGLTPISFGGWVNCSDLDDENAMFGTNGGYVYLGCGRYAAGIGTDDKYNFAWWSGGYQAVATSQDVAIGNWVHIVGTWDGTNIRIYYNGTLEALTPVGASANQPIFLGSINGGRYFNGGIDEAFIYDRNLTDNEILRIYQNGVNGTQYPFQTISSYPTNSSWNYTNSNFINFSRDDWNNGNTIYINSTDASFTFTSDIASNWTCSPNDWNYTTMLAWNESSKLATIDTTSHALTTYPFDIPEGDSCIYCAGIAGGLELPNSTSGCLPINLTIPIPPAPLNYATLYNLTLIEYAPNWSLINWSNIINLTGNYTWNYTFNNLTQYNYTGSQYNITNNDTNEIAVYLSLTNKSDWFNYTCNGNNVDKHSYIFNITGNSHRLLNCTLSLINISQTYVNWIKTIDRATWDVSMNITSVA